MHGSIFIGLDVHKATISVAVGQGKRGGEVRHWGTIPHRADHARKLVGRLAAGGTRLQFCYEAGPCGYGLQRQLVEMRHDCIVVAPSLIPVKTGDRVKTDRRNAVMLAKLHRAGELTAVRVPDAAHEARRAGGRGSRSGGTCINGAAYNPRVLIALLPIFRIHCNFFEVRQYVSPINKHEETAHVQDGTTSLAVPGSDQRIEIPKRRRRAPLKRSPAMRAGIHQVKPDNESPKLPNLARVLYQPWLFHGTPLWSKFQRR